MHRERREGENSGDMLVWPANLLILVVVVGVAGLVETGEGILEDLVEGGLAPSCGAHTHHTVPHQLGLIQLYHLVHLWRGDV